MNALWTRFLWLLPAEPVMMATSIKKAQPSDDFSASILYRTEKEWVETDLSEKRTCFIRACKRAELVAEEVVKDGIVPTDDIELRVTDADARDWVRLTCHTVSEEEAKAAEKVGGVIVCDRHEVRRRIWTPEGTVMEPCWSFNYSHCARCALGELYLDTQRVATVPDLAGYAIRSEIWVGSSQTIRPPRLAFSVEAAVRLDSHPAHGEFLARPGYGRKDTLG